MSPTKEDVDAFRAGRIMARFVFAKTETAGTVRTDALHLSEPELAELLSAAFILGTEAGRKLPR